MNYLLSDVASLSKRRFFFFFISMATARSFFNAYQLLIVSFFFFCFLLISVIFLLSVTVLVALLFFSRFGLNFFTHLFAQGFFWLMLFFFYCRFLTFSRSPAPRLIFFGLPCSCQLLLGTMAASLSRPSARSGRTLFGPRGRGGCFSPRLCTQC